jgi:HlyD family secretion protein
MKKLLVLLALLMLGLAGAAWWLSASRNEAAEQPYTLAPAEHGTLVETVSATGTLQPQDVIPVGTELAGKVVEVAADFNQVVTEGDLLFRLDDRAAVHKLRQAEVAVTLARAEGERARALRDAAEKSVDRLKVLPENVSLRKDLDATEAQLRAAAAAVEVANVHVQEAEEARRLADLGVRLTRVYAPTVAQPSAAGEPHGGVGALAPEGSAQKPRRKFTVLDRKVQLNQEIGPPVSAQAFTLAGDLAQMQVVAQVAEGDIGRVRRGQRADFTVATYADDVRFTGRVFDTRLLPTSDHGAIFYRVVIDVANVQDGSTGDWQLRPGMTASVDVVVRRHEHVWKVPLTALNLEMPAEYVTDAARAKLARWEARPGHEGWQAVWTVGADGKPWPVFVRVTGANGAGEPGIRDVQSSEVLEWDPELQPRPDAKAPATIPQVIVAAPPVKKGGLFNLPKVKI